ncbi:MAG: YfiT family bacillithiol transferase [Candidatus Zixiibacteriota bacterium]
MLTTQERQDMIARMRKLPEMLEAAVKGLNDQQLDTSYGEGKWTVRQVVHHVAEAHLMAFARVKIALTEDKPALPMYDQVKWTELPDARLAPIAPSLGIIRALHERWCGLWAMLPADAWQRGSVHARRGEMTIDDLLVLYADHGDKHVAQIVGLRAAKGW